VEDVVADLGRWSGRRVLVTGCTGLIGAWLAKALADAGAQVVGTARHEARPWSAFADLALADRIAVALVAIEDAAGMRRVVDEHRPAAVFHLAGASQVGAAHSSPADAVRVNAGGTVVLLDAVRGTAPDAVVVIASTAAVYGPPAAAALAEDAPLAPSSPYAASKAAAEMIARGYAAAYGLKVVALRCANVYGPGDPNPERLVPSVMTALLCGRSPQLRSRGTAPRDFLYVKDAVRGLARAAARLDDGSVRVAAINLGSGTSVSALDLTRRLAQLAGHPTLEVITGSDADLVPGSMTNARAHQLLGWRPEWTLDDGLRETVAAYVNGIRSAHGSVSRER
jgi:nucleoside-diphosphate-sugar epimerase